MPTSLHGSVYKLFITDQNLAKSNDVPFGGNDGGDEEGQAEEAVHPVLEGGFVGPGGRPGGVRGGTSIVGGRRRVVEQFILDYVVTTVTPLPEKQNISLVINSPIL